MGRSIKVQIGDKAWLNKKSALEHYQKILASHSAGSILDDEEYEDIAALLLNHPSAKQKIGSGIKSITVNSDQFGTKCFHVNRTDGTSDNFSYKKCVNGESSPITNFSQACRKSVEVDIIKLRDELFSSGKPVKCQESGQLLSLDQAHIDHRQPNTFSMIVERFIEIEGIDVNDVEYISQGVYGRALKDSTISMKFRNYHKEKAKLRVVAKDRNLRRSYLAKAGSQKKDLRIT